MKLQITAKELQRALGAVSKVIRSKNAMPILDNALLHQDDNGKYLLTASDLENEMTVSIDLMLMDGKFAPVCINPKALLPALANLPEQPLNITINHENQTYATCVEYLGGSFNIVSLPTDEFPKIQGVTDADETIAFSLPTSIFLPCLRAASLNTAYDELRPIMQNVLFDVKEDGVVIVGSDGHTLYRYSSHHGAPFGKGTGKVLVNRSIVTALDNAFKACDEVSVRTNGKFTEVKADTAHFVMRQYEGNYPNYNSVIPVNPAYHITCNVKAFISALKRVSLFASDASHMVKMTVIEGHVELSAEDIDFSTSSKETLEVEDINVPDGFAMGFKDSTVLQHLNTVVTDSVRMCFTSSREAIVMHDDDPSSALTLLFMPMLLND